MENIKDLADRILASEQVNHEPMLCVIKASLEGEWHDQFWLLHWAELRALAAAALSNAKT
jgi:hypothetical protein